MLKTHVRRRGLELSSALLFLAVLGCTGSQGQSSREPQGAPAALPQVLATIDGKPVTLAELRARSGAELDRLETQYLQQRSKLVSSTLGALVRERLVVAEATRQGKTPDELLAAEAGGSLQPTPAEVAAWYEQNRAGLAGRALEELRPQIAEYLAGIRREAATQKLQQRLEREHAVTMNFEPFRFTFDNTGAPIRGTPDAPVTLVQFADFQCPFCTRLYPTLRQIGQAYAGKVRIIYRQFPLTGIHQHAQKAAEATLCAQEQGKFWELHDLLYTEPEKLDVATLKEKASRLGLDRPRFDACLDQGVQSMRVQKDLREGQLAGVGGTPTLFLDGVLVAEGAVPYEVLSAAIDKALAERGR